MKSILGSIAIAFTMYSRIPVPRVSWEEENRRFVLCAFPFVGAVIGLLTAGAAWLVRRVGLPELTAAALVGAVPLLLTGGIHLDGLVDTMDALHSYAPRERKLEILKDSHVGAFAVIGLGIYLMLWYGAADGMLSQQGLLWFPVCMVLSRAFSALTFVTEPDAREDGFKVLFGRDACKIAVLIFSGIWLFLGFLAAFFCDMKKALCLLVAGVLLLIWYIRMSRKQFGGLTGDLAGFYLQVQELVYFLVIVMEEAVWN